MSEIKTPKSAAFQHETRFGGQDDEGFSQFMGHTFGAGTYWGSALGTSRAK
jgi:hypothetical protein